MKRVVGILLLLCMALCSAAAQDRQKVVDRVKASGTILDEIMGAPDQGIPSEILGSAECVAIVPSMLKGAFGFGAQYGRGVASCKLQSGWSAPAFFSLKGGSFGLQIGGQAVDLVMVVMNQRGMQALLANKVKLGADVSAAAGPVGRQAEATTDWKMRAQVLTYSRARGVFAGLSLNGAVIRQDHSSTESFYGHMIPFKNLLTGMTPAPKDAQPFILAIRRYTETANQTASTKPNQAPAGNANHAPSATPNQGAAASPSQAAPIGPSQAAPATPNQPGSPK
jgi:lipid-binding SYLF domain-containing protein